MLGSPVSCRCEAVWDSFSAPNGMFSNTHFRRDQEAWWERKKCPDGGVKHHGEHRLRSDSHRVLTEEIKARSLPSGSGSLQQQSLSGILELYEPVTGMDLPFSPFFHKGSLLHHCVIDQRQKCLLWSRFQDSIWVVLDDWRKRLWKVRERRSRCWPGEPWNCDGGLTREWRKEGRLDKRVSDYGASSRKSHSGQWGNQIKNR